MLFDRNHMLGLPEEQRGRAEGCKMLISESVVVSICSYAVHTHSHGRVYDNEVINRKLTKSSNILLGKYQGWKGSKKKEKGRR